MKKTLLLRAAMMLLTVLITSTVWAAQPNQFLDTDYFGGDGFIHIRGWAYDPDVSTESIDVQVYVYTDASCTNQYGSTHIIHTNVPRPDVNTYYNITGNHGFRAKILINDAGDYWVKVFAIDKNGEGNPQIGNTINVTVSAPQNYTAQDGETLAGSTSVTVTIPNGTSITLNGATINGGIVCAGTATITLGGTNSVTGLSQKAGIQAGGTGTTLTIRGNGSLTATGTQGAGIGGGREGTCGDILISGGVITATGGSFSAGIGASVNGTCGNITISGGVVTATGGTGSPGIGTGAGGSSTCGNITISGGDVTATGTKGAGIGTGFGSGTCGDITISGGVVTATGEGSSAGIGSGTGNTCGNITITENVERVTATKGDGHSIGASRDGTCGTVTIGGVVTGDIDQSPFTYNPSVNYKYTVQFNSNGGSGTMANQQLLYGIELNLTANTFTRTNYTYTGWNTAADGTGTSYTDGQSISSVANATANATVTLYAQWIYGIDISGITSDYTAQDGEVLTGTTSGTVTIPDGASITLKDITITGGIVCEGSATIILAGTNSVTGLSQMAGIQAGGTGTTLTIRGNGSLTATGTQGAGIGGGREGTCGDILISGGVITATGGSFSAGIGASVNGTCGNITISGGVVTATGGTGSPGIGTGAGGSSTCGNITISGGDVTATGTKGAGIGTGFGSGTCGDITISGGVVTATGEGSSAGIGSGTGNTCGNITITENVERVTATKGDGHSIGAGDNGTCGTVTIGGDIYIDGISISPYTYIPESYISLNDNTAYTRTSDFAATSATYTKMIKPARVGIHQAWMIPFDYKITAADLEKFTFYKINMIANSPDPSVETNGEMWVFLTKLKARDILHANMPYVYKAKEAVVAYPFITANVTVKAKNTGVIAKSETLEDIYSFYATYENTPASESDPFYYVSSLGNICLGTSISIGPYRWIVRKTSKFGNTTTYAPEMRFFDGEEDGADGIGSLTPDPSPRRGEQDDAWYDLNGRKLNGKPSQKGFYIHNGKKILK